MKHHQLNRLVWLALVLFMSMLVTFTSGNVIDQSALDQSQFKQKMTYQVSYLIDDLSYVISHDATEISSYYLRFRKYPIAYEKSLYYQAINLETGQSYTHPEYQSFSDLSEEDQLFYLKIQYDNMGRIVYNGSEQTNQLLSLADGIVTQMTAQTPQEMSFCFVVPKDYEHDGGIIDNLVKECWVTTYRTDWSSLGLTILAVVGLMFFMPMASFDTFKLFAFFKQMRMEISCLFLGLTLFADYQFGYALQMNKQTDGAETILIYLVWFVFIVLFSILVYLLRYYFTDPQGMHYLQAESWLAKIWHEFKKFSHMELGQIEKKHLGLIMLIHLSLTAFLLLGWHGSDLFVASIFVVTYALWLYGYLRHQLSQFHHDYQVVLEAMQSMSEGSFDCVDDKDFGKYSALKVYLSEIGHGFEAAVEEETRSSRMKTELITGVSHDLKTPMTGISSYVELLEDETIDDKTRQAYLGTLKKYVKRMNTLIEDLFDISKASSGNLKLEIIHLDALALLYQVKTEYDEMFEEKKLTVKILASDPHIYLDLDGSKTCRIFENLFDNIGKYALESTRVYLEMSQSPGQVDIYFKNISKDPMNFDPKEITERFVQGDQSRHGGSGLGLAIVKSFTEIQNGQFEVLTDGDLFKAHLVFYRS